MGSTFRKIWQGSADGANQHPLMVEGLAIDAFAAGDIVEQTATGLQKSTKAATVFGTECLVAREIPASEGGDIDTLATIGDTAAAIAVRSGEFVLVRSAVANYTAKGVALSSAANGQVKIAATDGSEQILFYTDEIVNVTVAGTLISVRKA